MVAAEAEIVGSITWEQSISLYSLKCRNLPVGYEEELTVMVEDRVL